MLPTRENSRIHSDCNADAVADYVRHCNWPAQIWGGQTLNYKGSMASLYYSTYSTGREKNDSNTTYDPPAPNYIFDHLFTQPQNLPPGTPLFRDIDNLSYRQSFTPHTGCY
jgi:hypothetical protein